MDDFLLMIGPDNKPTRVRAEDEEKARSKGYQAGMVMADKAGKSSIVKQADLRKAQEKGYVPQQEYDIKQSNKTELDPGTLEAGARGIAAAGTAGFADEVAGAGDAVKRFGQKALQGDLASGQDLLGAYERGRDRYRDVDEAAYQNNKLAYGVGAVLPTLATLPATAGLGVANAIKTGAIQGGLGSLGGGTGQNQTDITDGDIGKLAKETAMGAAFGGGIGGVAAKYAPKLADWLKGKSSERATKAIADDAMKAQRKISNLPGGAEAFGKDVQDLGIVKGIQGTKGILGNARSVESKAGKEIDSIYQKLDNANNEFINPKEFTLSTLQKSLDKMDEYVTGLETRSGTRTMSKPLRNYIDETRRDVEKIASSGDKFTFKDLNQYKRDLDKLAFPDSGINNQVKENLQDMRRMLRDTMVEDASDLAKTVGQPKLIDDLQKANRSYSVATTAKKALEEKAKREAKNRSISLTDYITGGALGVAGATAMGPEGAALGIGAAGANKLGRMYGNQALAAGSSKLAQALQNNPALINYLASKMGVSAEELLKPKN